MNIPIGRILWLATLVAIIFMFAALLGGCATASPWKPVPVVVAPTVPGMQLIPQTMGKILGDRVVLAEFVTKTEVNMACARYIGVNPGAANGAYYRGCYVPKGPMIIVQMGDEEALAHETRHFYECAWHDANGVERFPAWHDEEGHETRVPGPVEQVALRVCQGEGHAHQ